MRAIGFCLSFLLAGDVGVNAFVPHSNVARRSPPSSHQAIIDPLMFLNDWVSSSSLSIADDPAEAVTYSKASYYTILGLYMMSFPGLWSQIKRSTTAKIKRKTYVSPGEKAPGGAGKDLRQQAGEIMACEYIRGRLLWGRVQGILRLCVRFVPLLMRRTHKFVLLTFRPPSVPTYLHFNVKT